MEKFFLTSNCGSALRVEIIFRKNDMRKNFPYQRRTLPELKRTLQRTLDMPINKPCGHFGHLGQIKLNNEYKTGNNSIGIESIYALYACSSLQWEKSVRSVRNDNFRSASLVGATTCIADTSKTECVQYASDA